MEMGAGRVLYVARLRARKSESEAVALALLQMAAAVIDREPGCLVYAVHQQASDPSSFLIYEVYADHEALLQHRTTPHMRSIIESLVVPRLEHRDGAVYELLDGRRPTSAGL